MSISSSPSVLILGARSDIGHALAHEFARAGSTVMLAARNATALEPERTDLALRYSGNVTLHEFDALAFQTHAQFVAGLGYLPDIVICVVGVMTAQAEAERDFEKAQAMMLTNYIGPASILGHFASAMETRGSGKIIGISSIAGERGRASNYIYGSSKAGFTAFLEGLQHRLAKRGVTVEIVKPGFVATRMTAKMNLPAALLEQPDRLATTIRQGKGTRRSLFPSWRWALIAQIVRHLPNLIFLKTKL